MTKNSDPLLEDPSGAQAAKDSGGHPVLLTGLYTGCLLVIVMFGSLVAANRMPGLEQYALERNATFYSMFVLCMFVPIFRFLDRPVKLFATGISAWLMFIVAYEVAGMIFVNLFVVLRTPLQALMEGAAVYGVVAAGSWVGGMVFEARRNPIVRRRRAPVDTHQQ
ncbi:MAG TPA: hypothetical protein VGR36_10460 [Candidatus Acidoferrales bacterium]|nr:hypothetical protein [Candidatus Acidoferrales bacterium]